MKASLAACLLSLGALAVFGCSAPASSEPGASSDDFTSSGEGGAGDGGAEGGEAQDGGQDGAPAPGLTIHLDGIEWEDPEASLLRDHVVGGAATGDSYVPPTKNSLDVGFMLTMKANAGAFPYLSVGKYPCDTVGKPSSGERLAMFRSYFELTYKGSHYAVTKDDSCTLEVTSDADGADGRIHIVGTITGEIEKQGKGPVPIDVAFDLPY